MTDPIQSRVWDRSSDTISQSVVRSLLPRLLYVGDVPIESTYHGSVILYRLFEDYPWDRLMVVEAEPLASSPPCRLRQVQYRSFAMSANRFRKTRFSRLAGSWISATASATARRLRKIFNEFAPDSVLTVAHGYSWLAAAQAAHEARLPLHLIVHDDWAGVTSVLKSLKGWHNRQFARVYRQSVSRFCVSPFMEEQYRLSYGIPGHVLYPCRAKDCPAFEGSPRTYARSGGPLVGAYAGNIFYAGHAQLLKKLAASLEKRGGRMLLFGPHSPESLKSWGLNQPNILAQEAPTSRDLISRLRQDADFVFVPMTFEPDHCRRNMIMSFPSKLTDYTATGLPLLVCGPEYSSALRWARKYAPVAEVTTSDTFEALDAAGGRLNDRGYREDLGRASAEVGNALFSYDAVSSIFYGALLNGIHVA
jgi:hypothetical protein